MRRWGEKPYYSLDYYLKQTFGEKVYKIALDGGMTCPNRDGTLGTRGCIFCSNGGSGDFAAKRLTSVAKQIEDGISFLNKNGKHTGEKYIAYFQSYSNTYAPVTHLKTLYLDALSYEKTVCLSIATRPDCFNEDIYRLLEDCNRIKPVWVELGLQTIHQKTADFIRRGYTLDIFEDAVANLKKRGITVIVHVILGLPEETEQDIIDTIHYLNQIGIDGIKLQLLHILRGTDLADMLSDIHTYTEEEYVNLVLHCISELSPDIVIHRLTGDGPKDLLLAPLWSSNKKHVLNAISHALKVNHIWQGKNFML